MTNDELMVYSTDILSIMALDNHKSYIIQEGEIKITIDWTIVDDPLTCDRDYHFKIKLENVNTGDEVNANRYYTYKAISTYKQQPLHLFIEEMIQEIGATANLMHN